jgi:hypothetical protein
MAMSLFVASVAVLVATVASQAVPEVQRAALMTVYRGLGCLDTPLCPSIPPGSACVATSNNALQCDNTGVTRLDLRNAGFPFGATIATQIGLLTRLIWIYLHNDGGRSPYLVSTIPSQIGRLSLLHELSISNQLIEGTLPSTLSSMTTLGLLYLTNNKLAGVVPALNDTKLTYFDLRRNFFVGPPPSLPASSLKGCEIQGQGDTNCFDCQAQEICTCAMKMCTTPTTTTTMPTTRLPRSPIPRSLPATTDLRPLPSNPTSDSSIGDQMLTLTLPPPGSLSTSASSSSNTTLADSGGSSTVGLDEPAPFPTGAVVGAVVGAVACIALGLGVACALHRRKQEPPIDGELEFRSLRGATAQRSHEYSSASGVISDSGQYQAAPAASDVATRPVVYSTFATNNYASGQFDA